MLLEYTPQDIEHFASKRIPFLLNLIEQALKDGAFTCLVGHQIPKPTHLGLANAVDAPKSLLDAIGIPRQIVVDHQVGHLKIHTFASGICGQKNGAIAVVGKFLHRLSPVFTLHSPVDEFNCTRIAKQGTDPIVQVVERVFVLSKDDDLPTVGLGILHGWIVLKQAG